MSIFLLQLRFVTLRNLLTNFWLGGWGFLRISLQVRKNLVKTRQLSEKLSNFSKRLKILWCLQEVHQSERLLHTFVIKSDNSLTQEDIEPDEQSSRQGAIPIKVFIDSTTLQLQKKFLQNTFSRSFVPTRFLILLSGIFPHPAITLINYPTRGVSMIASFEWESPDKFPPLAKLFNQSNPRDCH